MTTKDEVEAALREIEAAIDAKNIGAGAFFAVRDGVQKARRALSREGGAEPVIVKAARKPVVSKRLVMSDWIECSITLKRGLTGAKPEAVCHWAFEMVGARPEDDLHDIFPGTGAVAAAWRTWQGKFTLPEDHQEEFAA